MDCALEKSISLFAVQTPNFSSLFYRFPPLSLWNYPTVAILPHWIISLSFSLVASRRGDLQILGFCLLHWLCGSLPWDGILKYPTQVQEAKAR